MSISADFTVLIAEDEEALRNILVDEVRGAGFNVIAAEDGDKALALAYKHKPQVILLDQLMPILSGTHVLEKIRDTQWGKETFVIMLTNVSTGTLQYKQQTMMANEYMVKSTVSIADVITRVKSYLGIN